MAKRGHGDESQCSFPAITISNGKIKGYHAFRVKCVPGMEVDVRKEGGGKDEKALLCFVPDYLPDEIANTKMESKSGGKSYLMKDVLGKPVGQVQYFLNEILADLLDEGKVLNVKGVVTGLPTTTKVPHPSQKWVKGKKIGGGAYIPCDWKLHLGESACLEEILALIQGRLRNIDEEGVMGVEVQHVQEASKKSKR